VAAVADKKYEVLYYYECVMELMADGDQRRCSSLHSTKKIHRKTIKEKEHKS